MIRFLLLGFCYIIKKSLEIVYSEVDSLTEGIFKGKAIN